MKTIDLHQVDAFTDTLFGGNPAGVITNADGLNDEQMTKIAREMNLSETAFVLSPTVDQADLRLRYFTPTVEVKFCGHATIGALYTLARAKLRGLGDDVETTVRVETNTGVLSMSVTRNGNDEPRISFVAPQVDMRSYRLQGNAFAQAFGIPAEAIVSDGTILIDRELNYVYIPVTSLQVLGDLTFDFTRVRQQFADEHIVIFCFYTNETKDGGDLHARGLAPLVGVDEDPFTGSMQAGLVYAAKQNSVIPAAKTVIKVEQGHFVGRPGQALVRHDTTTDNITVVASAAPVFSTNMEV